MTTCTDCKTKKDKDIQMKISKIGEKTVKDNLRIAILMKMAD